MYRNCVFCYKDLGDNQALEECPIGRRLAFDAARGRLWVVCRHCERWNLTPFEERWEAVEACERRYRGTRLRYSTPNIGLARLKEGLELVRIGEPLRPELAAWRYGDQFGRRRRKYLALSGAALVTVPLALFGAYTALAAVGVSGLTLVNGVVQVRGAVRSRRTVVTLPEEDGRAALPLTRRQLDEIHLRCLHREPWHLSIPANPKKTWSRDLTLSGDAALTALQRILPHINFGGGSRRVVSAAVEQLETVADPDTQVWQMVQNPVSAWYGGADTALRKQPLERRLALEMLLRETHEERSMRGELWRLEREWRQAEELANIADNLLTTPDEAAQLERLRRTPKGDA